VEFVKQIKNDVGKNEEGLVQADKIVRVIVQVDTKFGVDEKDLCSQ
jgi:hypothetical protein